MSHKSLDYRLQRLSGRQLAIVTVWGEARGESIDGQSAVMHVIQNRMKDRRWGNSYHSVLGAWAQFSCLWESLDAPNFQSCVDVANALEFEACSTGETDRLVQQIAWLVDGVIEEALIDNTFGSTHYYSTSIKDPFWAKPPGVQVATIGRHKFWRGVL